jgi:nitroreductase
MTNLREPDFDINPIFIERWSSRSYVKKPIPHEELMSLFEAARWTPSAMNAQPWRFLVGTTEEDHAKFGSVIFDRNWAWCKEASVFALLYSDKFYENGDENRSHTFDAGAASFALALEAENQGLATHMMGGFDNAKAREVFQIPDHYELHVIIAIGYRGPKENLPAELQLREQANNRNKVETFVSFLSK